MSVGFSLAGTHTCEGCGVEMFAHVRADDTWGFVDGDGRYGTDLAPDGRNLYEILNEMSDAILADCKQAKKKGNPLQLPEWYVDWYSLYAMAVNIGINPFHHNHHVITKPSDGCFWHCGEPMWFRPSGWHCRANCQNGPFDPLSLTWVLNDTA